MAAACAAIATMGAMQRAPSRIGHARNSLTVPLLCVREPRKYNQLSCRSALAHGVVPTLAASGAALAVTVLRAGLAADAAVLSRILALLKVLLTLLAVAWSVFTI